MKIRYVGTNAKTYKSPINGVVPGDVKDLETALADALIAQGDWEPVIEAPKKKEG